MLRRNQLLGIVLAGIFASVVGVAWAVGTDDPAEITGPVPELETFLSGTAPSGADYRVSRVDLDLDGLFCRQIATDDVRAQGCEPRLELEALSTADDLHATRTILGDDLFVSALVPNDVASMRITVADDEATSASETADVAGVGRFLIASAPTGSTQPQLRVPAVRVKFLDSGGEVVAEQVLPAAE